MRDNYPDFSFNDKDAPWNEKTREIIEWEDCQHGDCGNCGAESLMLNEKDICEHCYYLEPDYYDEAPDETSREED